MPAQEDELASSGEHMHLGLRLERCWSGVATARSLPVATQACSNSMRTTSTMAVIVINHITVLYSIIYSKSSFSTLSYYATVLKREKKKWQNKLPIEFILFTDSIFNLTFQAVCLRQRLCAISQHSYQFTLPTATLSLNLKHPPVLVYYIPRWSLDSWHHPR